MKKIIISLLTGIGLLGFGVNVIMADALASDNTRAIDAAVPEIILIMMEMVFVITVI